MLNDWVAVSHKNVGDLFWISESYVDLNYFLEAPIHKIGNNIKGTRKFWGGSWGSPAVEVENLLVY